jgi:hypothetical protein
MKAGLGDAAFVIPCVRYFSTVLPNSTYGRLSDVLLFCDYVLEFFQQSYPIPTYKQGLK